MTTLGWAKQRLGEARHELATCGSTNDELARLARAGAAHGTVVRSDRQTDGRGRGGNRWSSDDEGDLYASILLRPRLRPADVPALALVAGIGVARAAATFGVTCQLKWPNDVVCGPRKLGGILCEASSRTGGVEHVIIGIGVNVARARFSDELRAIATSMALELGATGSAPSPAALLTTILTEIDEPLQAFARGGVPAIRQGWVALCRDIGATATATVDGVERRGLVRGITDSGALDLETDAGDHVAVVAGEVRIDYPS